MFFSPSAILFNQLSSGTIRTQLAAVAERAVGSHDGSHLIRLETALTEVRESPHTHSVVCNWASVGEPSGV